MQTDIDAAIAEFERAIGDLISDPLRREIARIQSKISHAERLHKPTRVLRQELVELRRRQVERELAA